MKTLPHADFLRELYALCQKHGVHLDGTEDDGVMVVPNEADMDLSDSDSGQFAFFVCRGDGSMRCYAARETITSNFEADYDAGALDMPPVRR